MTSPALPLLRGLCALVALGPMHPLADRTQAAIYALQKRLVPLNEVLDKDMQP